MRWEGLGLNRPKAALHNLAGELDVEFHKDPTASIARAHNMDTARLGTLANRVTGPSARTIRRGKGPFL
jgi:hypothetical protein